MKALFVLFLLLLGGCTCLSLEYGWLEGTFDVDWLSTPLDHEFGGEGPADAPDRGDPPSPPDKGDDAPDKGDD